MSFLVSLESNPMTTTDEVLSLRRLYFHVKTNVLFRSLLNKIFERLEGVDGQNKDDFISFVLIFL